MTIVKKRQVTDIWEILILKPTITMSISQIFNFQTLNQWLFSKSRKLSVKFTTINWQVNATCRHSFWKGDTYPSILIPGERIHKRNDLNCNILQAKRIATVVESFHFFQRWKTKELQDYKVEPLPAGVVVLSPKPSQMARLCETMLSSWLHSSVQPCARVYYITRIIV